jgi:hypothetical protein
VPNTVALSVVARDIVRGEHVARRVLAASWLTAHQHGAAGAVEEAVANEEVASTACTLPATLTVLPRGDCSQRAENKMAIT